VAVKRRRHFAATTWPTQNLCPSISFGFDDSAPQAIEALRRHDLLLYLIWCRTHENSTESAQRGKQDSRSVNVSLPNIFGRIRERRAGPGLYGRVRDRSKGDPFMKLFECRHCGQLLYFENTRCERCGRKTPVDCRRSSGL
jgi:hypothetical protein